MFPSKKETNVKVTSGLYLQYLWDLTRAVFVSKLWYFVKLN